MHDDYDFTATFDFDDSEWKAIDDALALLEEKFAMLDEPVEERRMASQAFDGPGKCVGRGLVPCAEQGEKLIGDLGVGHRLAVLVGALHQHGQDVVAFGQRRIGARGRDEVEHHCVILGTHRAESCPSPPSAVGVGER